MDIVTENFYRATLAASMPAGPMGIDKGQKAGAPFYFSTQYNWRGPASMRAEAWGELWNKFYEF